MAHRCPRQGRWELGGLSPAVPTQEGHRMGGAETLLDGFSGQARNRAAEPSSTGLTYLSLRGR